LPLPGILIFLASTISETAAARLIQRLGDFVHSIRPERQTGNISIRVPTEWLQSVSHVARCPLLKNHKKQFALIS